jgi:CW-type Zinc Finger
VSHAVTGFVTLLPVHCWKLLYRGTGSRVSDDMYMLHDMALCPAGPCTRASTRHLHPPVRPACRWMPRCCAAMRSTSCWRGCGCMQRSTTATTGDAVSGSSCCSGAGQPNHGTRVWSSQPTAAHPAKASPLPRRVQCSACSKWRILTFDAMQAIEADAEWTCSQLRCAPGAVTVLQQ